MKPPNSGRTDTTALRLLAGLLVLYLLAPFAAALAHLGQADWHGADSGAIASATLTSVAAATTATLLVCLGGIPLGFLLARADRSSRRSLTWTMIGVAVQLPLALPPLSSGVLLLFLLGYASPLGRLFSGALTDSFAGIVLAETFVSAPFLVIAARSAFRTLDPAIADVAATLGHSPGAIFWRVSLPISTRAILAGAVLAWLRAFGEFGATVMVSYHPYSLPVFTYVAFGSEGLPTMLPVIVPTLGAALLAMAALALLQRGRRITPPTSATDLPVENLPASNRPAAGLAATSQSVANLAPTDQFTRDLPSADLLAAGLPRTNLSAASLAAKDLSDGKSARSMAEPGPAPILTVHAHRQLDGFSLDVVWRTAARRLAILGASGSGKSMTLRTIAGLEPGLLQIGDRDLSPLPPQARGVGYVPQSFGLFPHLPIAAQLGFATDADPARVRYWTGRLGLDGFLQRLPSGLSLGQQQRVALGRALSRRTLDMMLLDEPFSALDAPLRTRLRSDLLRLLDETGLRSILVTHDPAEAMLLADEMLLLDAGRVLQSGPVEALFSRPISEAAARLLGAICAGHGIAEAPDRIAIGDGIVLCVAGAPLRLGPVGWAVRPHQVRVAAGTGDHPATIVSRGHASDGQRRLLVRLGDASLEALADPGCPPEGPCRVSIDPAALQVWPLP